MIRHEIVLNIIFNYSGLARFLAEQRCGVDGAKIAVLPEGRARSKLNWAGAHVHRYVSLVGRSDENQRSNKRRFRSDLANFSRDCAGRRNLCLPSEHKQRASSENLDGHSKENLCIGGRWRSIGNILYKNQSSRPRKSRLQLWLYGLIERERSWVGHSYV